MNKVVVLGAGVTGLAAAQRLKKNGISPVVLEKSKVIGGLCNSFKIGGFTFDTFAHVSFDNDLETDNILCQNTKYWVHTPDILNYADGIWTRHPIQNNLVALPVDEKIKIIESFISKQTNRVPTNYQEWLMTNFGTYFSEKYPGRYTHKYWTVDTEKLEYKWIEGRMTVPCIEELLRGAMEDCGKSLHYAREFRYPEKGGFKSFLQSMINGIDIKTEAIVEEIDTSRKILKLHDGREESYDAMISTIPLNELVNTINEVPNEVKIAASKLDYTSGVIVSIGFNRPNVSPAMWFYIYDEDIYPARVYAPGNMSKNNTPDGYSSLQAEVYFSKYKPLNLSLEDLKEKVIDQLMRLGLFERKEIVVSDVRSIEYANIMFTPQIYMARSAIHNFLDKKGIYYAGRWGEWDYLWVGQSFRSGVNAADKLLVTEVL